MKLINIIGIYLLTAILLLQAFMMPIVYLDFKLRQDYIAKVLCINRDKPEMHCNGHCILMQKMKKARQTEQSSQTQHPTNEVVWLYCLLSTFYNFELKTVPSLIHSSFYRNFYVSGIADSLFHPPQNWLKV